jgi:hypothetical protein
MIDQESAADGSRAARGSLSKHMHLFIKPLKRSGNYLSQLSQQHVPLYFVFMA